MTHSDLTPLLDAAADLGLFGRGTVNHLPMALIALDRMGATPHQLAAFDRHWRDTHGLVSAPSNLTLTAEDWPSHIRDPANFYALQAAFQRDIGRRGPTPLIGVVITALHPGIGALAFHALIRLAYGLEAAHAGEIAAGLAALVTGHQTFVLNGRRPPTCASVEDGLLRMSQALDGERFGVGAITAAMASAAQSPKVCQAYALPPASGTDLLAAMSRAAVRLYGQTGDFTVLHMVTATHALRIVAEAVPAALLPPLEAAAWSAFLTAYASIGAPRLEPSSEMPTAPWDSLLRRACESLDDHAIKLTYTCWREETAYGGPHYSAAAVRVLAPLAPA